MIINYFYIICSHEISEAALGRKSLGLVIIVVDFLRLKKKVFSSGEVYIWQTYCEEGNWDGWPTYESRQKRYIYKKKQGQTPCVMTIFGIEQENILLVKLNTIMDYTANVGTSTAAQFVVLCPHAWVPPADG